MKAVLAGFVIAALTTVTLMEPAWAEGGTCEGSGLSMDLGRDCHDGDIARFSVVTAADLPKAIQGFCDFSAQIITLLDDPVMTDLSGKRTYVVLCRYHRNK